MIEPAGRPYDITPQDHYTAIAIRNQNLEPIEYDEWLYYTWFKQTQLKVWQSRLHPHPIAGELVRVDNILYMFNGELWHEVGTIKHK
jgi:hypothetical protein